MYILLPTSSLLEYGPTLCHSPSFQCESYSLGRLKNAATDVPNRRMCLSCKRIRILVIWNGAARRYVLTRIEFHKNPAEKTSDFLPDYYGNEEFFTELPCLGIFRLIYPCFLTLIRY